MAGPRRDCDRPSHDPIVQGDEFYPDWRDRAGNRAAAMMLPSHRVRVLVSPQPVDFRKGHDGLATIVSSVPRKNPFASTVFVFRLRRDDRLKLLYWDGKRLRAELNDELQRVKVDLMADRFRRGSTRPT